MVLKLRSIALAMVFFCLTVNNSWGQAISMTATSSNTQTFAALPTSSAVNWTDNSTIAAWYSSRTGTSITPNAGASNTAGLYSYGTGTNADRALGSIETNTSGNIAYGVQLQNNSSSTITTMTVAYTGEQWRKDNNATADRILFYYRVFSTVQSSMDNSATSWTAVTALGFRAPISGATTATALDGNATANRESISAVSIPTLTLPAGQFIVFKWINLNISGSDHGVGIDDVTVAWTVPVAATAPTVTTTAVSSINTTSASSGGTVTATGGSAITFEGVIWSTSPLVTTALSTKTSDGTATPFTSSLTPLAVNTQYYYNAYAINAIGTSYGTESNFYTLANAPATPTVDGATTNSLNVTVNVNSNPASTEFAIRETNSGNFVQANGTLGASAVWQTAATWGTKTVTGLASSTGYTFDVKARNGASTPVETTYSTTASGTTLSGTNSITITSATFTTPICNNSSSTLSVAYTTIGTVTSPTIHIYNTTTSTDYDLGAATSATIPVGQPAGTYQVKVISANGVSATYATSTLVITQMPAATIAYNSGNPYCTSTATPQSATLTGTTGGVFSGIASGLNASTGAITPSTAGAGTPTITYTIAAAGGCAQVQATTGVAITQLPAATIAYNSGNPYCTSTATPQSVTLTGTTGGVFSGIASGLNTSTGAIMPSTAGAGTPTVTYTIAAAAGCAQVTATAGVTINTAPTTPTFTAATSTNNNLTPCLVANNYTINTQGASYTYSWAVPAGWGSVAGGATTQITVTPSLAAGNVTASVTIAGCAAASASLAVTPITVPAAPTANGGTTPQITNVNPTNFTANWSTVAGASYQLDVYQGAPAVTYASDDFEGTLSGWSSTTDWAASTTTPIAGSQSLKNTATAAGESTIYNTPTSYDVTTGTTVWQVTMKNGAWAPSTGNKFWFFLMSSSVNLSAVSDVANGYAVGVNMTTTNSGTICLSKIVAGSGNPNVDLIASGVTWGSSGPTYSIRVTRTAAGVWSLETKNGGGYTGMTAAAATATDATYTTSTYSGCDFTYSITRAGQLWLDDYSITRPASITYVSGYQNFAVASGTTSTVVTPLSQGTNYTYVVRATNSCGTSANSNDVDVLTGTTGFNITASAGANGSISPSGTTNVVSGGSQAYTITPAACYNVASLTIDGVPQAGATSYTFTNVTANHSIVAAFALNTYTVTASVSGGNGSITATASHNCGTSPVYSFTPNSGYAVSDVLVNGVSQGASSSYTFINIAANQTIVVSFVAVTYSITTGTVSTFVCPGAAFAVPYTTNLPVSTAVAVQLSNSSGSFASPTQIGTGTTPTTITATMPTTASGLGYKVRVVAASPAVTGTQSATIASQFSLAAPIFSEGMGSSAYATIGLCESANGFDNDVYTMSGAAEIRITAVSGGYQEASAGGNVYLANSGVSTFRIDGINTNGSNPLTLNFGIQKSATGDNAGGLVVEYSINSGSSWAPITWGTLPTGAGTTGWYFIKLPGVIPQSTTLSLQFRNTTTANNIRLDDIGIYTGTASAASVSPSSPPAQCGGTIPLQASPVNAGYLWTGGTTASSLAVTTTGNYSVTVTDRFGCSAAAGPVAVTINTPATASVVISNGIASVCTDVAQTFTAAPTNGGTPTYLWYKNGISTGLTGNTYSPVANSLSNGDVISVSMTSTACVTTATVSSNTLTAQKFAYAPLTQEWIENFGTTTQTDVANYTSAANGGFTFTTGGTPLPDIRTSTVSPGGGANAYMGASGFATRYFTISGINTSNAFPNRLSFYVYNPSTSSVLDNNSFWLEYSTDGTNFSSISYSAVPAGQAWSTVSINNALPKAATVWLRFNSDLQGAVNIRIDDIKLEKYTVGDIAVTPANPIALCSATQVLTSSANPTGSGYTTLWSTGATTAAITVSSAGTYNVTLTDAFGCKSSASRTVSAGSGVKTWNGTNSNWNDPVNWSCGTVPTSADNVVIPTTSNDPIISLIPAGICKNLTIDANVSLTINASQYLNVYGNVVNNGAAAFGAGTLSFEGGTAATVTGTITVSNVDIDKSVTVNSGAALNIITSLDLQNGNLTNSGTVTLKSNASGTAYLDNFTGLYSGTYSGNLTVERYVANSGTHYISYPFTSTSYVLTSTTGFAGQVQPQPSCNANATASTSPYSDIYKWEEATNFTSGCSQQGWVAVTNENSVTGKGYAVSLGSNQTLSLTGAPILNDYNFGATKNTYSVPNPTPSAGNYNPAYTTVSGGLNMVGNPFPSAYEWDGGNSNVYDVAYVWETSGTYKGTYQTINPGTVLAVGQGFFVKADVTTNLAFTKANRRTQTNPTFYQTNNGANLDITMAGNGFADRTQIVFNDQSTLSFDGEFDGFKMLSNYSQPTLYTVMSGDMMASINTLPSIDQSPNVVMGMFVGTSGNYEFTFNNINSFDPTSYIYLEDTKTGTMQDMRANNTYSFSSTTSDDADRFVIHFTPAAEINTVDVDCNNSGSINITQPGTAQWAYTVTDNNNATISSGTLNNNSNAIVNALAGTYTLTLTDANNYVVMKTITVNGSTPIAASFTPSATTVEETNDVTFNSTTANAATTTWDFGDGTTASTATATHAYTTPGTYTVTLTVTNATGCSSTTTQVITVTAKTTTGLSNITNNKAINIWSNDNRVFIDFSKQVKVEATIEFYNVLGQQLMQEKFGRSSIFIKELSNLEAAYVIVKVKNEDIITTKKVFIMNK